MKVLHVVGIYPTVENPQGGVFIRSQIESLKKKGISCDVCVLEGTGISKYLRGIGQVRKKLKEDEYDLIHAHYAYTGWTVKLASLLPLIVSFMGNDVYGDTNRKGKYPLSTKVIHALSTIVLSRLSSWSIVKSVRMISGFPNNKVTIIPNGVDLEIFYPKQVVRAELGLDDNKKYVLFTSNPDKSDRRNEKRFDIAVESVKLVRDKMPETEMVWLEKKKQEEVAKYLNAVDCLLLTSEHEGSPNMVKEALACNLPVISRDVGDVAERIKGVKNCYIISRHPNQIAETLVAFLGKGGRAEGGFESMRDLSIERIADRIVSIYNKVLI